MSGKVYVCEFDVKITCDGQRLLVEGEHHGILLASKGSQIPFETAERYGLVGHKHHEVPEEKKAEQVQNKKAHQVKNK